MCDCRATVTTVSQSPSQVSEFDLLSLSYLGHDLPKSGIFSIYNFRDMKCCSIRISHR